MAKTKEDIDRICEIADRLEALGIPREICGDIRIWANREMSKIIKHGTKRT